MHAHPGPSTPGLVARTPLLHALAAEWRGPRRRPALLALAALVPLAVVVGAFAHDAFRALLGGAGAGPWLPFVAGALGAAAVGRARDARRRATAAREWTASLPVAAGDARLARLLWLALPSLLAAVPIAALATGLSIAGEPAVAVRGALAAAAGLAVGIALAGFWPTRERRPDPPGSRYVLAASAKASPPATLAPLAGWAVREAFVRVQPRAVAPLLSGLVLVPATVELLGLLRIFAIVLLGGAALVLLASALAVYRRARAWLAPLPVAATGIALGTCRYALPAALACAGAAWVLAGGSWA